jgi:hypothetical protein
MISRLSAIAATFAVLVAATLAVAASAHQPITASAGGHVRTVQLERVIIVAKRDPDAAK